MRGGGPVIVALAGTAVFGEVLPPVPIFGVVLVCAGIVTFAGGRAHRRATAFAVGNAVVIAAYTLIDAKDARASGRRTARNLGAVRRAVRRALSRRSHDPQAAYRYRRRHGRPCCAEALDDGLMHFCGRQRASARDEMAPMTPADVD